MVAVHPHPSPSQLRLVEKLSVGSEAYLQAALLYTTVAGQRRIRVHTLALTVTDSISTLFKNADLDAQVRGCEAGGGRVWLDDASGLGKRRGLGCEPEPSAVFLSTTSRITHSPRPR